MKVWIDTNVIIDVLEERKGFADISWKVWELCRTTKIIGYISALSVPNIVYIMRKELDPKKTTVEELGLYMAGAKRNVGAAAEGGKEE